MAYQPEALKRDAETRGAEMSKFVSKDFVSMRERARDPQYLNENIQGRNDFAIRHDRDPVLFSLHPIL